MFWLACYNRLSLPPPPQKKNILQQRIKGPVHYFGPTMSPQGVSLQCMPPAFQIPWCKKPDLWQNFKTPLARATSFEK